MQKLRVVIVVAIDIGFMTVQDLHGEEKKQAAKTLTLVHRYTFPASIKGHFDHFTVDPRGKKAVWKSGGRQSDSCVRSE